MPWSKNTIYTCYFWIPGHPSRLTRTPSNVPLAVAGLLLQWKPMPSSWVPTEFSTTPGRYIRGNISVRALLLVVHIFNQYTISIIFFKFKSLNLCWLGQCWTIRFPYKMATSRLEIIFKLSKKRSRNPLSEKTTAYSKNMRRSETETLSFSDNATSGFRRPRPIPWWLSSHHMYDHKEEFYFKLKKVWVSLSFSGLNLLIQKSSGVFERITQITVRNKCQEHSKLRFFDRLVLRRHWQSCTVTTNFKLKDSEVRNLKSQLY